ncbi:MAG: glycosyltransferase family 1 protein, partial [Ginsengibacter sp.]
KVPQCLIAFDKVTTKSLGKVNEVIADSEFSKKEIIEKYKIGANKIDVVYKGVEEIFQLITFLEKESIKGKYASGNEYFLYTGTMPSGNNLLNLLKAFSAFKKMQKSNMQLLIATKTQMPKEFLETLRLFKFKSEVQLLDVDESELAKITASAYAFVYPFAQGYLYALQAMISGVPILTSNTGYIPEVCGDAALYFDENEYKKIADKMMLIYKDENARKQLIEKGRDLVKKYSWDNSADSLWKCIEKACR